MDIIGARHGIGKAVVLDSVFGALKCFEFSSAPSFFCYFVTWSISHLRDRGERVNESWRKYMEEKVQKNEIEGEQKTTG